MTHRAHFLIAILVAANLILAYVNDFDYVIAVTAIYIIISGYVGLLSNQIIDLLKEMTGLYEKN